MRNPCRPWPVGSMLFAALLCAACGSVDDRGALVGEIDAPLCWRGAFNLAPDYFAAAPYRRQLGIRMQRGSESYVLSDSLSMLVDDIDAVRAQLGVPLPVGLSSEVTPVGVPLRPELAPPMVQATLSLEHTCKTENVALFALSEVRLGPSGECVGSAQANAQRSMAERCAPDVASSPRGKSSITFQSLFNNDITSLDEATRLSDASFELYLADPRERCPNADAPPPPCRGHLTGNFHFLFERAKPAQPFP